MAYPILLGEKSGVESLESGVRYFGSSLVFHPLKSWRKASLRDFKFLTFRARNEISSARLRVRPAHLVIESLIDFRDLCYPALAFRVFHSEYLIARPVKVKGDIRYLLIEPI